MNFVPISYHFSSPVDRDGKVQVHQKNFFQKIFFIKNHIHQKPHSSKTTFIKKPLSSKNHFHQKTTFIKKPLSSKNHFHHKPLSSKNHFHQKPVSSKTTFIRNHFHQKLFSSEKMKRDSQFCPCLCEGVAGRRPATPSHTRLVPAFRVSTNRPSCGASPAESSGL